MDPPPIDSALDDFHDAALGLIRWDDALQSITEALGARSCVLIPLDQDVSVRRRLQLESKSHARFTSIWLDRIEEAPDPHTTRPGLLSLDRHPTVIEHQIATEDERSGMAYYRSIAGPGNRAWWASIRFRTRRRAWALPLYRTERQGPYTVKDARRLDKLMPAIRRTVAFAETVMEARTSERLELLSDFGCPGFLLDREGSVLRANDEAEQLLGSGLWLSRGMLVSDDRIVSRTLRDLCAPPLGRGAKKHASALLMRDDVPWLVAQIAELSPVARDVFCGGRRLLLLRPVASNARVDANFLTVIFGLTAAEARLASELTSGTGLDACCAALGISRETGRTHLKSIFRKTNAHTQAELAALLNRMSPGYPT